jgi:hypothetical protein
LPEDNSQKRLQQTDSNSIIILRILEILNLLRYIRNLENIMQQTTAQYVSFGGEEDGDNRGSGRLE